MTTAATEQFEAQILAGAPLACVASQRVVAPSTPADKGPIYYARAPRTLECPALAQGHPEGAAPAMASPSAFELLQSAQAALAAEAAAVSSARDAIEAERAALDRERERMGGAAAAKAIDGDVITLNVGGTLVCTQRRTLTAARDSLLGAMFSGRWEESLVRDAAGHAFLDDDPVVFASVLAELRARAALGDRVRSGPRFTPEYSAHVVALVDKYALRDYLLPAPFVDASVKTEGAAVCDVILAVTLSGRALCVSGGAQLPQPLQVVPLAHGFGQPPPHQNQAAPGAFGFVGAAGDQREPRGVASMLTPRTMFRKGVPADGSMIPVAAPFMYGDNVQIRQIGAVQQGDFATKTVQWMVVNPNNGQCWAHQGQQGGNRWGARGYPVPLSRFALFAVYPGCRRWVVTLRQLSEGAMIGVATDAQNVHGLLFLRSLHKWGAPDSGEAIEMNPSPPQGFNTSFVNGWQFLPVVAGIAGLPEATESPGSQLQVAHGGAQLRQFSSKPPQMAYCHEGLLSRVCEGCSLLVELRTAPSHTYMTSATCLVMSLLRNDDDEHAALPPIKLCSIPLPESAAPWNAYVQPMPGDVVYLQHEVDAMHPTE